MSLVKPRSLFSVEDDGLIQRLNFNDSEDDDGSVELSSSPIGTSTTNNSSRSNTSSDDDRLDSSIDSAISDLPQSTSSRRSSRHVLDDEECHMGSSPTKDGSNSPPYRKVRALRLFGSPQSPKTLLKQCELSTVEATKRTESRLLTPKVFDQHEDHGSISRCRRIRPPRTPKIEANINPFTQTGMFLCSNSKRRRGCDFVGLSLNNTIDDLVHNEDFDIHPAKRKHLRDTNISRYETEFYELNQIGSGDFGSVYRCINRLDGCEYALKKSRKPLKGTSDERRALNEVYAHAVLGQHIHVVRYFSAWAENDHMLIQNEYCNGGSLADAIDEKFHSGVLFSEKDVKQILKHIALGLKYIHSLNLAHMDIKPGNIFIIKKPNLFGNSPRLGDSSDDGFDEDEMAEEEVTYKIGDLGHVTSLANPAVEEGDCRYIPTELLKDNYMHLPKADIFALGLTMFEVCGGGPLPKNGTEWHSIREGNLPYLHSYPKDLNKLIKQMIHPDPERRPSSAALIRDQTLVPHLCKTKEQLNRELIAEKFKNQLLSRQLERASLSLKRDTLSASEGRLSRLLGGKLNRSNSVTNF